MTALLIKVPKDIPINAKCLQWPYHIFQTMFKHCAVKTVYTRLNKSKTHDLLCYLRYFGNGIDENLYKHRFIRNLGKNYSRIMLTDIQVRLRKTTD